MTFSSTKRPFPWLSRLRAFPFFVLSSAALLSVTNALSCWGSILLGGAVLLLLFVLERRRKILLCALALLVGAWVVLLLLKGADFLTGFKILCNNLFENSEAAQAYRYRYFSVPVVRKLYPRFLSLTTSFLSLPLALLFYAAGKERSGLALCALIWGLTLLFVVFGVFAGGGYLVALYLLTLLSFLPSALLGSGKRGALLVSLLFLFGAGVFALSAHLYEPSESVASFSERIRDLFDEKAEGPLGDRGDVGYSSEGGDTSQENEAGSGSELATSVRRLPVALLLFGAVVVVVLSVPLAGKLRLLSQARKLRKDFSSPEVKRAIRAYYTLSFQMLRKRGLAFENRGYRNYAPAVEKMFGSDYAETYRAATEIYEKTLYSRHEGSEGERAALQAFYERTRRIKRGGKV